MNYIKRSHLLLIYVLVIIAISSSPTIGESAEDWTQKIGRLSLTHPYRPATSTDYSSEEQDIIDEWPQVQRDAQRTGYTSETLGNTFQVMWTHPFQPEKVYPQAQAIVYAGKVFVGTEMGNMYALDALTGAQEWVYNVGAPILNSVAASDSKVFFGAMDGSVYALDVSSGALIWKSQLSWRLGFSTAPVIADNKIMLGGRNGTFYALDLENGSTIWEYDVGFPILQTAAWSNGTVIFGAMDMHVYALDSHIGSLVWQSEKIPGVAFKDYWPVIYNGYVVIMPMTNRGYNPGIKPSFPFGWFGSASDWNWLTQYGPNISNGSLTDVADAMIAQDNAISNYHSNPSNYTKALFILDENTGEETFVVPHWTVQTMNGATTPPCIDRDGKLIVPVYFIRSGWGRLDLSSQRIIDILYDHRDREGGTMNDGDYPAGMGNADESLNVTCTGNSVLTIHTQEDNAAYTGVFNLENRTWYRIGPGHTNLQMNTNTQGGGGNPASVANGIIYHISVHELIARSAQ